MGLLQNKKTIITGGASGIGEQAVRLFIEHGARVVIADMNAERGQALADELGENALQDAFKRFKDLADRKKIVYDEDIEALVDDEIGHAHERIKVASLIVVAGTNGPQSATLTLDIDGQQQTKQATGNGPVDALFNAIHALVPHTANLELYQVHAVTEGTDAQAEVSVRLEENGRSVTAKSADPDTLVASAKAYVAAMNKLITKRAKTKPEPLSAQG